MPYLKVRPLSDSEKKHGLYLKAKMPYISGVFAGWVRVKLPGPMPFEMKCWVLDSGSLLNMPPDIFEKVISRFVDPRGEVQIGVCTSDSRSSWNEKKHFPIVIRSGIQKPPVRLNMRTFYIGAEPVREYFNTDDTIWFIKAAVLDDDLILVKKTKYSSLDCIA